MSRGQRNYMYAAHITNRFLADRTLEPNIVDEPNDPSTADGVDLTWRRTTRNTLM